jgi:hypothetical protein
MNKRISTFILFISVTLSVLAGSVTPYSGSRIFWDTATRKIVFNNGGYARMIQLADSRLLAVTENNGIDIAFSSNLGASWTSPTKIVYNRPNVPQCVPDLIQLADGTIIVGYNPRPREPYSPDRRFGIKCKRSVDNGKTWSEEINIFEGEWHFSNGCWEPSFLQLPSGEVRMYFADETPYTTNNDQQISMCRSFDGGISWSEPIKITYRAGSRDGMPSAVILKDGKTIATAFEDNGWPGVWDFIPTIGISTIDTNWDNYWIYGNSNKRWKACNYDYVPSEVKGGAPYLRVLPWGETVLSHQSTYGPGGHQMYVYVGNEEAKDFKAMSAPFSISESESAMWNSLAVIDTGIVVAVAPINGRVEMIKGYPVNLLHAPYGSPTVDGKQDRNEGYYKSNATQMILGREKGTRFTGDFAFDDDNLYFTSRISDRTPKPQDGSYGDGITLLLDTKNISADAPTDGIYRIFFRRNGTMQVQYGKSGNSSWQHLDDGDTLSINYKVTSSNIYYIVEAAIPWSSLGFSEAPCGQDMRANLRLQNLDNGKSVPDYEMLPDSKRDESWSWMKLHIGNATPNSIGNSPSLDDHENVKITVQGSNITIHSSNVASVSLYNTNGMELGNYHSRNITLPNTKGLVIARIVMKNGKTVSRKIKM